MKNRLLNVEHGGTRTRTLCGMPTMETMYGAQCIVYHVNVSRPMYLQLVTRNLHSHPCVGFL
jgi:hypothetical protein